MNDENKLLNELTKLRKKVADLEKSEAEHKQLEFDCKISKDRLLLRNKISKTLLSSNVANMYEEILSMVLEEMKSRFGYFGYIDNYGNLACPSMTKGIWDQCAITDKSMIFHKENWGGLWGRSLLEKKSLISNQLQGIPKGHMQIKRALACPIIHENRLIGQIVLADKSSDYTDNDIIKLEDIIEFIAPILKIILEKDLEIERRIRVEEALIMREEKYKLLFKNAPVNYQSLNKDGNILEVNNSWLDNLGYRIDEVIGVWFGEFLHPEQKEIFRELFPLNIQKKEIISGVEFTLKRKDGSCFIAEYTARIGRDTNGKFLSTHCTFQDITARRKAEKALKISEELYHGLFETNQAVK